MKKILSLLMILLVSITLVSCKEETNPIIPDLPEDNKPLTPLEPSTPILTMEEEIVNLIKTGINESLLDGDFNLEFNLDLPFIQSPENDNPDLPNIIMKATEIGLKIEVTGNLTNIESSYVYINATMTLGEVWLLPIMDKPWFADSTINFTFAYYQGNLYSSFESILIDGSFTHTLEDLLPIYEFFILMMIPPENHGIYNLITDILIEHKEKMFIGNDQESFDLVYSTVSDLLLLVNLINVEMITNSGLSFELNEDKQIIVITKGDDLIANVFDDFILNIEFVNGKFSSINGDFGIALQEELLITFDFNFSSNITTEFDFSILDSYEEVEILNIIKVLMSQNPQ